MAAATRRLVAYDLFGAERGQVPAFLAYDYSTVVNDWSTLTLDYPEGSPRWEMLDGTPDGIVSPVEIRFQRKNDGGIGWSEDFNSRLWLVSLQEDKLERTKVNRYQAIGVGELLRYALVKVALDDDDDPPDPGEGPTRPVKRFVGRSPGFIMKWLIDRAQADDGWCPEFGYTFTNTADSDAQLWPDEVPYLEVPAETPVMGVLEWLRDHDYVDFAMQGYSLAMWPAGTFLYRDNTSVLLRYGQGATSAPRTQTWHDLATDAVAYTEDGKTVTASGDLVLPAEVGRLWRAVTVPGTADSTIAQKSLGRVLAEGNGPREELERVIDWSRSRYQPGRDFRIGDRVTAEKGKNASGWFRGVDRVIGWRVSEQGHAGQRGGVTLANRQSRREDRLTRAVARLTQGAGGGELGPNRPLVRDPRAPDAPTDIDMTATTYLDRRGRQSRVLITFTITAPATTHDTPDGVQETINLRAVHLYHRVGSDPYKRIRGWDPDETDVVVADFDPDVTHDFKALSESHDGVLSPLSSAFSISSASDEDREAGPNQVQDAGFRSTIRQAARQAATSDLSFVTDGDGTVAALASTSAILKTGVLIDGSDTSGRFRVQAGDTISVKAMARMSGFSAATLKAYGSLAYDDGTSGSPTFFTEALTGSYAEYAGTATATKSGWAEVRFTPDSVTGTGSVRVQDPYAARQAKAGDIEADAIRAEHIIVGVELSSPVINAGVLNSATLNTGTLDIGSNTITFAGVTLSSTGGDTLATDGSFFAQDDMGCGGDLNVVGTANLTGPLEHSGSTAGFYGTSPVTFSALSATVMSNQATIITVVNSIRSRLQALGLG